MRHYVGHYILVLAIFLAFDFAWLSTVGRTVYVEEIGALLRDKPNLAVAFAFYALFALGLTVFVVEPSGASSNLWRAGGLGALFGLVAYATYDLTNLATIKGFTLRIAIIDMIWGAVISGVVTVAAIWAIRSFKI